MKKIRIGILGCANIAEKYAISAFVSLPNVELVSVASRDAGKAEVWAKRYGIQSDSYESLVARDDIDVIYSPLPVGLQEEWALKAARAGKHVICEKSITFSLESAQRMVNGFREKGLALYENFVPAFHPQHAKIMELIAEGKIGVPNVWSGFYGFPSFKEGDIRYQEALKGGSLNDCGCYTVFMSRKILHSEPLAVTCKLSNEGSNVDMKGEAFLEFPNATALMAFGFKHMYQNSYSVWGSKGIIRTMRAFAIPPDMIPPAELIVNDGSKEIQEPLNVSPANQFALSFAYFCNVVLRDDKKEMDRMYENILQQAKVLEAMRVSAREGRRVVIE